MKQFDGKETRLWAADVVELYRANKSRTATPPMKLDKVSDVVGSPRESFNYEHLAAVMAARQREL